MTTGPRDDVRPYPPMTLAEFTAWLSANSQRARVVFGRAVIRPCHCGDLNCRGWRLVRVSRAVRVSSAPETAA